MGVEVEWRGGVSKDRRYEATLMWSCLTRGMSLRRDGTHDKWNGWLLKEKGHFSHCNKREGTYCASLLIATEEISVPLPTSKACTRALFWHSLLFLASLVLRF